MIPSSFGALWQHRTYSSHTKIHLWLSLREHSPKLEAVNTQHDMPYAERRQLTVLFSDLVGSTAISDTIDPEDMRVILHDYQAVCTSVVGLYDGFIAKYLGDGTLPS